MSLSFSRLVSEAIMYCYRSFTLFLVVFDIYCIIVMLLHCLSYPCHIPTIFFHTYIGFVFMFSILPLFAYLLQMSRSFCSSSFNPFVLLYGCEGETFYSMVERKYWDVYLFGYYRWNHIPDFLVATPTLIVGGMCCLYALITTYHTHVYWIIPMIMHMCVLLTICITTANIQIVTRMLMSSTPLFVWYAASVFKRSKWIQLYWIGYCVTGSVLFALFLPWTCYVCYKHAIPEWKTTLI